MPDHAYADGDVLDATTLNTYVREQVVTTCTSSTRPTNVEGRLIYETDTDRLLMGTGSGSNWIIMAEPVQSHTLTVTSTIGTITTVGTTSFSYYRFDGGLRWRASIAITTNGTGSGAIQITLPFAPLNGYDYIGSGRARGSSGKMLSVTAASSGATATVANYDNTYPAASGETMVLSGWYQLPTRYS